MIKKVLYIRRRYILVALVSVVFAYSFFLMLKNQDNKIAKTDIDLSSDTLSAEDFQKTFSGGAGEALKAKDYKLFQSTNVSIAQHYILNDKAQEADKVIIDTLEITPDNEESIDLYLTKVSIENKKDNKSEVKKYYSKIVEKAKSDGDQETADYYQKVLDKQ